MTLRESEIVSSWRREWTSNSVSSLLKEKVSLCGLVVGKYNEINLVLSVEFVIIAERKDVFDGCWP